MLFYSLVGFFYSLSTGWYETLSYGDIYDSHDLTLSCIARRRMGRRLPNGYHTVLFTGKNLVSFLFPSVSFIRCHCLLFSLAINGVSLQNRSYFAL